VDRSFVGFLELQRQEGLRLAEASDVVDLLPLLPQKFVVGFNCLGFVRAADGAVGVADRHEVGIYFPEDYLRRANFLEVLTWLGPVHAYHPNIHGPAMKICPGPLAPGTPLVDLIYQIFEVITCYRVNMREYDCLNPAACPWARVNQHRFPVDRRPLKRSGGGR
jgi:hypothetical protein